eukprot:m.229561 g.229561  ORF g.229561 m.229561 type:complete len:504 (-) comp17779_c0_seq1:34-1545(-)
MAVGNAIALLHVLLWSMAVAQSDDDDVAHSEAGNTIGGAVGGMGIFILLVVLVLLVVFSFFRRVHVCVPAEHVAVASWYCMWVAQAMKLALPFFLIAALSCGNWIQSFTNSPTDFSSSSQLGLFTSCSCTNMDQALNRVGVSMVPPRDRLRRTSIFFMTTSFVLLIVLVGVYAHHLTGTLTRRGWLVLGTWGYVFTAFATMFAMASVATIYHETTSTDTTLLPNLPVATSPDSDLGESFAFAVIIWVLSMGAVAAACWAHKHRAIPAVLLVFTWVLAIMNMLALISHRWILLPTKNDPNHGRTEIGLFENCQCTDLVELNRRDIDPSAYLSSAHKSERISTTVFAFFSLFIALLINLSTFLNALLRRNFLPARFSNFIHPFLLLVIAMFLTFALSIFGGLYGDMLAFYHHANDTRRQPWYLPIGPGYGFVVAAWFLAVLAAVLEVLANNGLAGESNVTSENRREYQPILQSDSAQPPSSGATAQSAPAPAPAATGAGYESLPF